MIQHSKRFHENQPAYNCQKCGTSFNRIKSLGAHIKVCSYSFSCKVCDQEFSTKRWLTEHQKKKHTVSADLLINYESNFSCEHCQSTFSIKGNLKRHVESSHSLRRDVTDKIQTFHKRKNDDQMTEHGQRKRAKNYTVNCRT